MRRRGAPTARISASTRSASLKWRCLLPACAICVSRLSNSCVCALQLRRVRAGLLWPDPDSRPRCRCADRSHDPAAGAFDELEQTARLSNSSRRRCSFFAQLREFCRRQGFGARRLVDELRRTIKILRIDRRQNLRRAELGPQARDLLVERGRDDYHWHRCFVRSPKTAMRRRICGRRAPTARAQSIFPTGAAIPAALRRCRARCTSTSRYRDKRAAGRGIYEVPIQHGLLGLLDQRIHFFIRLPPRDLTRAKAPRRCCRGALLGALAPLRV